MPPRPRPDPATRTAVVTLPRPRGRRLPRLLPSRASFAVAGAIAAAAVGAYVGARETSVFAVRELQVVGAPPAVSADVRAAARTFVGTSLVALDVEELSRRVRAVPAVASVQLDRAFPNTLALRVVPERPAIVLRRGADAWLVSDNARVVTPLLRGRRPPLPRVWVEGAAAIRTGGYVRGAAARAVAAVSPIVTTAFAARVQTIRAEREQVTFVLRSGLEVKLGDLSQLELKLAVAREIVASLGAASARGYVDVSVPERPVAANPQVAG